MSEVKSFRLVKVANELNLGTHTILEYLKKEGFEIEDKPVAKLTEEMYNALLKEFGKNVQVAPKVNPYTTKDKRLEGYNDLKENGRIIYRMDLPKGMASEKKAKASGEIIAIIKFISEDKKHGFLKVIDSVDGFNINSLYKKD